MGDSENTTEEFENNEIMEVRTLKPLKSSPSEAQLQRGLEASLGLALKVVMGSIYVGC